MVCIRCQKRPAIIFIQRMENGQMKQEGYCLHCARELHIKPVDDLMKQFGMSEQDLDNMENRMESMMEEMGDVKPALHDDEHGRTAARMLTRTAWTKILIPGSNATFPLGFTGNGKAGRRQKGRPQKRQKAAQAQVFGYLLREPDPQGAGGQAGRYHWPRPRNLPHHPDFEPPPEEQPLPHRRSRCGQDRHCRRHCRAHCQGTGAHRPAG